MIRALFIIFLLATTKTINAADQCLAPQIKVPNEIEAIQGRIDEIENVIKILKQTKLQIEEASNKVVIFDSLTKAASSIKALSSIVLIGGTAAGTPTMLATLLGNATARFMVDAINANGKPGIEDEMLKSLRDFSVTVVGINITAITKILNTARAAKLWDTFDSLDGSIEAIAAEVDNFDPYNIKIFKAQQNEITKRIDEYTRQINTLKTLLNKAVVKWSVRLPTIERLINKKLLTAWNDPKFKAALQCDQPQIIKIQPIDEKPISVNISYKNSKATKAIAIKFDYTGLISGSQTFKLPGALPDVSTGIINELKFLLECPKSGGNIDFTSVLIDSKGNQGKPVSFSYTCMGDDFWISYLATSTNRECAVEPFAIQFIKDTESKYSLTSWGFSIGTGFMNKQNHAVEISLNWPNRFGSMSLSLDSKSDFNGIVGNINGTDNGCIWEIRQIGGINPGII